MLVGLTREHDKGLRRILHGLLTRVLTQHLGRCAADYHNVRASNNPMRAFFGHRGIMIVGAYIAG